MLVALFVIGVVMWLVGWIRGKNQQGGLDAFYEAEKRRARQNIRRRRREEWARFQREMDERYPEQKGDPLWKDGEL